ncbi:Citrate lyase subunit beta-like protein [Corynebacterium ciconiae DSM 44920]|uniref:HpcH/HpaI aldolase/citrate lyase family protein n=1 Tax=Corynebacterium ciconiae TaxID=227319 RepID=UPI00036B51E5|nr:CoA ester lyase [Corynebacterium ciconiae]WKD61667.1 Citrate lyase subunit beta-like protein [Corynebacterium ciconiae DSM 44920]
MSTFHLAGPALLFAPVNRPEIIPKAAARADMVILDLEDGAGSVDRDTAYATIREARLDPARTFVRVVGPHDEHHEEDLRLVAETEYRSVIIPKLTEPLPDTPLLEGLDIVPIIEHPQAVSHIAEIARDERVVGLYWGADDFTLALNGASSRQQADEPQPGRYRAPVEFLRTQTLIHAAAAGKFAIDAVYQDFTDLDGLYLEALDSARMGFAAYPCIHPSQVDTVRRAFNPSEEQLEWARRIAAESQQHPGAFRLDGEMVDTPLIALAHRLLERAEAGRRG